MYNTDAKQDRSVSIACDLCNKLSWGTRSEQEIGLYSPLSDVIIDFIKFFDVSLYCVA